MNYRVGAQAERSGVSFEYLPSLLAERNSAASTLDAPALLAYESLVRGIPSALRFLAAAAGWAFFLFSWWRVTRPNQAGVTVLAFTGVQIGEIILAIFMVASLWVFHNLRLSTKGHRQTAHFILPQYEKDFLGRTLVLPATTILASAPEITLRMEAGKKVYEPEGVHHQVSQVPELAGEVSR
jgi:hypothetical protein